MTETALDALQKLREPFSAGQMGKKPQPYKKDSPKGNCQECGGYHGLPAMHLDFVGHAALTDRLLDTDIEWTWRPMAVTDQGLPIYDQFGGLWIWLTVCGVTRPGYGSPDGKTGGNAVKEAIGDALRNAGMRFGAALDLWHKGDLHDAQQGNQPDEAQAQSVPDNAEAIAELKEVCGKKEITGEMADKYFRERFKVSLANGSSEDIKAFTALVRQGAIEVK